MQEEREKGRDEERRWEGRKEGSKGRKESLKSGAGAERQILHTSCRIT
jgi:hypothetical protein